LDRSEWKLSPKLFQKINHLLGSLTTNLLARRLSAQLPAFISWKLDSLAVVTYAFSVDWSSLPGKLYANPPWNLVGRVPSHTLNQRVVLGGISISFLIFSFVNTVFKYGIWYFNGI